VFCVGATITSFREIPLAMLDSISAIDDAEKDTEKKQQPPTSYGTMKKSFSTSSLDVKDETNAMNDRKKSLALNLGTTNDGYSTVPGENFAETSFTSKNNEQGNVPQVLPHEETVPSLSHYLMSIIHMPHSLQCVCVTNFFCWSAHVCYSLYFTDFVGESVFEGDPKVIYANYC
jgi:solute carrier family 45 protein 1/2/4